MCISAAHQFSDCWRTRALNELAKTSIMGSYTAVFWLITSQRDCQVSETEFWLSNSNLCCSSCTLFQMVLSDLVNCFIQFTTKNDSFTNRTSIWTVCLRHTLQVVIFSFLHRPIVLLHKTIRSNRNSFCATWYAFLFPKQRDADLHFINHQEPASAKKNLFTVLLKTKKLPTSCRYNRSP